MEFRGCALSLCLAAVVAVLLAGCGGEDQVGEYTPSAVPTPTPVFTSDDDALAAATDVYKNYVAVIDEIARDGGSDPERIKPYVNESGLKSEAEEAKRLRDSHAHLVGSTVVSQTSLQQRSGESVTIYACQDGTNVDIVDETGASLVPEDRADFLSMQVSLEAGAAGSLIVTSEKPLRGIDTCD